MADNEVSFKLGVDAVQARTNLKEFQGDFEETLRLLGKSDAEVEAFSKLFRQVEQGRASLDSLDAETRKLYQDYTRGAQEARAADALGVRSQRVMAEEIARVRAAYDLLAKSGKLSQAELAQAAASAEQKIAALGKSAGLAATSSKELGASITSAAGMIGPLSGLMGTVFSAQKFLEANVAMQALERSLTQITGSTTGAAHEMEYIRGVANRLGLEVQSTSAAYMQFMAATKGTSLEGAQARRIFESVAGAMGQIGKSSAETERALVAVAQMASKGTVSMEELKQQLGDALPGAMQAAADGAGLTVQQLGKMVESGTVLSADLLPKLADGLNKMYGTGSKQIEGFAATWNRMKNVITETATSLGDSGIMAFLEKLTQVGGVGLTALSATFRQVGESIGIVAGSIATLTNPLDELAASNARAEKKTLDAARNFGLMAKEADATKGAVANMGGASGQAGAQVEQAGKSALAASADYAKLAGQAKETVQNLDKLAEARKAEAAAMMQFAAAFGTEEEKRQAAVLAAQITAESLREVSAARQTELTLASQRLAQMQQEAAANPQAARDKAAQVAAQQELVAAKQAEIDKAAQLAAGAQIEVAQRQAEALAYQDNAARLGELTAAYEKAAAKYREMQVLASQGDATDAELKQAKLDLAQATLLYRDALSDQAAAAQLAIDVERQRAHAQQGALSLEKESLITAREVARVRGDTVKVAQIEAEIRNVEIKMLQASAAAAHLEAQAMIAAAKAKAAELEATGKMTPALRAQIDAQIAAAEAKELESQKSTLLAERLREVGRAMDEMRDRGSDSTRGLRDGLNAAADASDRLNESLRSRPASPYAPGGTTLNPTAAQRAEQEMNANLSAEERALNVTKRAVSADTTQNEFIARQAGLRGDDVKRFAEVFGDILDDAMADWRARGSERSITGTTEYREGYASAYQQAVNEAASVARRGGGSEKPAEPAKTYQVNLNIGGRATSINVADDRSAQALVAALQQAAGVAA